MKARFDVKQQPVKVVENNDEAYVFICLNEEEKEETITYIIYPEEPEDTSDDVDPGFSVDPIPDDDSDDTGDDSSLSSETDEATDENDEVNSGEINEEISVLEETIEGEGEGEIEESNDTEDSGIIENTVVVKYYEYDYNEFHDKKDNLDLDDIQANPENYLDYSPSQKTEESNLEEDFNSLKAQFDEMKETIERGLSL